MDFSVRTFLGNVASLYGVQAVNILIPLVTFPYLVRTIGFDGFGVLSYAFSWMQIGVVFTMLGFNYTATREVAANREDPAALSETFSVVLVWKIVIASIMLTAIVLLSMRDPVLANRTDIVLASVPLLIGEVLFPAWFFLGMEQMRWIALFNLTGRIVGAIALFTLVHAETDLMFAAICQSLPMVIAGLIALVWVRRDGVRFVIPAITVYRNALVESARAFSTSLPAHVYARGQFIVLGQFASEVEIGYYSVAQRVTGLFSTVMSPIAETFFPHICRLNESDDEADRAKVWPLRRKLLGLAILSGIVSIAALYFMAPYLVRLIAGEFDDRSTTMMRYFAPIVAFIGVSALMRPFVMALRRYRALFIGMVVGAAIFLALSIPLTQNLAAEGMLYTMLVVEFVVMATMVFVTRKKA